MRLVAIFTFTILYAQLAWGTQAWVSTKIDRVMITEEGVFGGCVVRPSATVSGVLDCKDKWISLDCEGVYGTKSEGARRLDAATLAALIDAPATLRVDDARKVNGWCIADRVQVSPQGR